MRNTVGMLAAALVLLIALPGYGQAESEFPKKYGLEFQLGGGYYMMDDVNDFIPHAALGLYEPDKIHIGSQFGFAILYRQWWNKGNPLHNFGWQIGWNRLLTGVPVALEEKYYISAYLPTAPTDESWAEQTVVGSEVYALATWYGNFGSNEVMLGIGPALYYATLDRSVDIVQDPGSHLTAGSFADAGGKALGLLVEAGLEMPMTPDLFLVVKGGGRLAKVGKLTYEDNQGVEQTVWIGGNATLPVDFTGGFFRVGLRTYFKPTSDWRTPK